MVKRAAHRRQPVLSDQAKYDAIIAYVNIFKNNSFDVL